MQTDGAFAVFGHLVGLRGSQTGLTKQNDGAREGERMRERMSGAERGLQAAQREGGLARTGGPLQGSNGAHNALPHTVSRPD